MKFRVYGEVSVGVVMEVEADSADEAIDIAHSDFIGLTGYAGNGGTGKLIGTTQQNVRLEADGEVEFHEAERA